MKCLPLLLAFFLALPAWAGEPVATGAVVPNFSLLNQDGNNVKLSDFRGKVVLVTFLYTQCPFPEKCPMISSKLEKTRALIDRVEGGRENLQVLSITLDPENDTPEALKAYAQGMDKDFSNWSFLTSSPATVARVASLFGVLYWDQDGTIEHNMRTALIDRQGRLHKLYSGSDWRPGELAAEVKSLIDNQ